MIKFNKAKLVINKAILKLENKKIKRDCRIDMKDVLYGLCLKAVDNCGYVTTVLDLNKKDFFFNKWKKKISVSGFKNKANYINYNDIQEINDNLLKIVYNSNEPRILAVDGTHVQSLKALHEPSKQNKNENNDIIENNLKFASKNKTYCKSLISGLYDVENKIILNYYHTDEMNEREAFKKQTKYLKKNDIVLFDRGYFSKNLYETLNKINVNYVFRMCHNILLLEPLKKNNINEHVFTLKNKEYKVVRYKIDENGKYYYLFTSLINKTIDELKELYRKRWKIETHYKELKYTTSLDKLNERKLQNLKKSINIYNFIYILYYYFIKCFVEDKTIILKNNEVNHKVSIKFFFEEIFFLMVYKTNINKQILHLISLLPKTYLHKKKNRSYEIISNRTFSKHSFKTRKKDEFIENINSRFAHSNFY